MIQQAAGAFYLKGWDQSCEESYIESGEWKQKNQKKMQGIGKIPFSSDRRAVNIASRDYTFKKDPPAASQGLIDRIVAVRGSNLRPLSAADAKQLRSDIKCAETFEDALNKVYQKVYRTKSFQPTFGFDRSIYKALLDYQQGQFDCKRDFNWDSKKYLFSRIPKEERVKSIFHCFIKAADRARDFTAIQEAFQEGYKLPSANAALFGIFIKAAWEYGYEKEAKWALREAEKRGLANTILYNTYLDASCKCNRQAHDKEAIEIFQKIKKDGHANAYTYGIFINNAWGQYYLEEARQAFEEAKEMGVADSSTYTCYMNALKRNGRFKELRAIFEEAKRENKANKYAYNISLYLAGEQGTPQEVRDIFEELKTKKLEDEHSYSHYMWALSKKGEFEEVETAFQQAKQSSKVDIITYNSYISIAGKHKRPEVVKEVFQEARDLGIANMETFNSFILAMGNNGDLQAAEDVFNELKHLKRANIGTFTNFIRVAGKNKAFQKAKEAFEEAKKLQLAGIAVYTSFMDAAGQNEQFAEVRKTLREIETTHFLDAIAFTRFIEAAGLNGEFDEAKKAFDKAIKLGLVDNILFNTFIAVAGKYGEFQLAQGAFEEAKKRGLADIITYNIFIDIAGRNGQFQAAEDAFNETHQLNLTDSFTYNVFLYAAGINKQYEKTKAIFSEAQAKGMATRITFTSFISMAGDHQQFQDMREALEAAKLFDPKEVSFYNVFIDKMGIQKNFKEAKETFEEAKRLKIANWDTYATFINIAGDNQEYLEAKKAFKEAQEGHHLHAVLYANFIKVAGKNKGFEAAQEAFEEAVKLGYVDTVTYSTYMQVCGEFGKITEAKEIFHKMEELEIADDTAYGNFIHLLGSAEKERIEDIQQVFKRAKKLKHVDASLYNNFIHFMGKRGAFKVAKEAFEEVKARKLADAITFATFINIAGKNKDFGEVQKAWQEAEKRGFLVGNFIYNSYMDAARRNGKHEEVLATFRKAKELQIVTEISYSIVLKTLEAMAEFEEIEAHFNEARKLQLADAGTYSIFIRIAGKKQEFQKAKAAFTEATELDLFNTTVYNNYIQVSGINLEFLEAKKAFEKAKELKIANGFTYAFFIEAAGRMAADQARKNLKFVNVKANLTEKDRIERNQALEEPRRIFWEAKELGHLTPDIVNQFINVLGQYRAFDEAESILKEAESCGCVNAITRNILTNWQIQTSLTEIPAIPSLSTLDKDEQTFVNALLTPSYKLWNRLREMKQIAQSSTGDKYPTTPASIPVKLQSKLVEKTAFTAREGDLTFEGTLKGLVKEYAQAADQQKVQIEHMRLVGGGVPWCLGSKYYEEAFERVGGRPNQPFFDEELRLYFEELCKDRFDEPHELDVKILLASINPQKIADISDALPKHIAKICHQSEDSIKQGYFFKQCLTNKEGNLYSLRRIADQQGKFVEFIVGGKFARHHLFLYDALQLPIEKAIFHKTKRSVAPVAAQGSTDQAAIDYILKRLQASSPETINEYGWSTYLARLAQGCCSYDKDLELKLCQRVAALSASEKVELLVHGRNNHCQGDLKMGMTMVFHACSALCDHGFVKEAEELRAAAMPLCPTEFDDSLFQALANIWHQKECSFLEMRAILEALALFYLLSPTKDSSISCKINEHRGQQVIQLMVNGSHFSLPLAPSYTFNVLADACKRECLPDLQKLFEEWSSENPFKFPSQLSSSVAKFLTLKLSDLEKIDETWPRLKVACSALKKSIRLVERVPTPIQTEERQQTSFADYIYGTMESLQDSLQSVANKWWK